MAILFNLAKLSRADFWMVKKNCKFAVGYLINRQHHDKYREASQIYS